MKGLMNMKSMKKYLSLLLVPAFLLIRAPLPASAGEGPDGGSPAGTEESVPAGREEAARAEADGRGELIVGHPTVMKGDFFTEMFGNDTADIDVRALIHGYNLVSWDQNQGVYVFDCC